MDLKVILKIKSFSEVVGYSQPQETCPLIDNHQSDLRAEIDDWNSQIASLEDETSEEENEEEPRAGVINELKAKIEKLQCEISNNEDKIRLLEHSRSLCVDARRTGLAQRAHVLEMLDQSLYEYKGYYYLFVKEFLKSNSTHHRSHYGHLNIYYKDIDKNYESIISWSGAWHEDACDAILRNVPSSIIQLNLDKEQGELFISLIPKIEQIFTGERPILEIKDVNTIIDLFPEAEQSSNLETQIKSINLSYLWENFLFYLQEPIVNLVVEQGE